VLARHVAFLAVLLVVLVASSAAAQPSRRDLATARTFFRDGVAASEAGDWARALDLFERAHALSQRADVLLNVAAAQAELGRLIEAGETYRRFLAEGDAEMLAQHRADVDAALADVEARVPRLRVTVIGGAPSDAVLLDDEALDSAEVGVPIPVNPGAHVVTLRRAGEAPVERRVTLAERAREDVAFEAPSAPLAMSVVPGEPTGRSGPLASSVGRGGETSGETAPTPVDEGEATPEAARSGATASSSDDTPWIVLGVIGGVLAVGAGVTVGVVLGTQGEAPVYQGSVWPYSVSVE
jgi:hypothetical protein